MHAELKFFTNARGVRMNSQAGMTVLEVLVVVLMGTIVLAGYGARLARGCTSGQALTGGALLSVGSWVFMMAVFAGGYLMAPFVRRQWR